MNDSLDLYLDLFQIGLGLLDRTPRDTLVITGEDTIPWLQGLVTSDLHHLIEEGSGQRTTFVNTKGRFVGEARIFHLPELLFLDLEPGTLQGGLLSHLRRQIINEKVRLLDRSAQTARIGVYGEHALALLNELTSWGVDPARLPPFHCTWGEWNDQDLILFRPIWSMIPGFEIASASDTRDELLETLQKLTSGIPLLDDGVFEILRTEAGIPRFGVELHEKVIPLEAGFQDAIAFDKGCYLGQEIIARLDTLGTPAKLLRLIVLEGSEPPPPGSEVFVDDHSRAVGTVESSVYSPHFEAPLALAYLKRGFNDLGGTVLIQGDRGEIAPLLDMEKL